MIQNRCCAIIQRDLTRLGEWANRNVMKCNTGKCEVQQVERNNCIL